MPQVVSAPVMSPPPRSDAPARAAGPAEASGTFGEMLETSSAAPNAGGNPSAPAKARDASAPQAQGDAPTEIPPAVAASVDLALLVPELPVSVAAASAAPTAEEKGEGESPANADAVPADHIKQADDPVSAKSDAKVAEFSVIALVAPAPAPASAPIAVVSEPKSDAIVAAGANTTLVPNITTAAPSTQIAAATGEPPPSAEAGATPTQPNTAASKASPAGSAPAAVATTPDDPAAAESALATVPEQAETKPSVRTGRRTEESTPESTPAKLSKVDAAPGKEPNAPQAAAKPAQPHSSDAPRSADQPAEQDSKPAAHQPHAQSSEHASATARAAIAAAHNDFSAPASPTAAPAAQVASTPPLFGLTAAGPLASPLQTFWQPTSQRAESADTAVAISGLAVEIVSRAHEGLRRFEIRLDPPELGRIDVRLDVDRGGNVTSRLTVERAETLDLLRRDAPQLERALQHAGLNTEGGLQFSLRDQNFANREQTPQNAPTLIVPDEEPAPAEAARRGYGRLIGLGGGVDIRV